MRDLFGLDETFVRDVAPGAWRKDLLVALVLCSLSAVGIAVTSGVAGTPEVSNYPLALLSIAVAGILLTLRRRFPIVVLLLLTGVHWVVVGEWMTLVTLQGGMQVAYFLGLYTAMAWARDRQALMFATIAVLLTMTIWIAVSMARSASSIPPEVSAPLLTLYNVGINVAYFGAATWLGRNAWLKARDEQELVGSRTIIDDQSKQLADKAILDERLRIARELHDSVAHHVSLIGVQAAAARHAMAKKPEAAADALQAVEHSSRQTVQELQSIVGSLRDASDEETRPDLDSLPSLFEQLELMGLTVDFTTVGDLEHVSASPAATLYRVVQEALTNVRRHSTATSARVTLRITDSLAEVEVLDDGRSRPDTSGTRVGQVGIRERVAALGGTTVIGPRLERGYRVLASLPLVPEEQP